MEFRRGNYRRHLKLVPELEPYPETRMDRVTKWILAGALVLAIAAVAGAIVVSARTEYGRRAHDPVGGTAP